MNKRLKLLLINPTAPAWRIGDGCAPKRKTSVFRFSMLSSLSVAASAPPLVDVRIIDEDTEPVDFETDADLVGISFMTFNAPRAYEIAGRFRNEKGKTVIFGGYHPTFMPEEAIQHSDAICRGEAENTLPLMIEDYRAGRLKGVYSGGLANLKGLPVPDRSLIRRSAYAAPDAVQATRGCPNRCKFCSIASFFGSRFRARPVDDVIGELKSLGRSLVFMDDNIIADKEYAKDLFSRMVPLRKTWFSQSSIGIAQDDALLGLAARSGCRGMFIGLESLSQENLNGCNKTFNRSSDYVKAIEKIHAAGIGVFAGIVFGMDSDRPDVFAKTLEFLYRARADALQATILTPFPGTPLFEEMRREGRITDTNWARYDFRHVVFEPRHMSAETLKRGHDWVLRNFYSRQSVLRRLWHAFGYLSPSVVFKAELPLNLGYRSRLKTDGTFGRPGASPALPLHPQDHAVSTAPSSAVVQ